MKTSRLEAFSDGVIAIIITIMVLELRAPAGEAASFDELAPLLPVFLSYVLSFLYVGIYWNNHHHMLSATDRINGGILWANLHLLFWLSLFPFVTAWTGEHRFAEVPTVLYGVVLLMASIAYFILQRSIIVHNGRTSKLAQAIGRDAKGKLSTIAYALGIALAFINSWVANGVFLLVALMWLVPDSRIENRIEE